MKKALAFLFQREGKSVDEEDFIYVQSVDLDWFSSDMAREVIDKAYEQGLIKYDGNKIIANFDYDNIDIEMGFKPSKDIVDIKPEDIFTEILEDVLEQTEFSKQEIMSKVNQKQDKMNIEIKTALLMVAHENDVLDDDRRKRYVEKISDDIRSEGL